MHERLRTVALMTGIFATIWLQDPEFATTIVVPILSAFLLAPPGDKGSQ